MNEMKYTQDMEEQAAVVATVHEAGQCRSNISRPTRTQRLAQDQGERWASIAMNAISSIPISYNYIA